MIRSQVVITKYRVQMKKLKQKKKHFLSCLFVNKQQIICVVSRPVHTEIQSVFFTHFYALSIQINA